MGGGGGGARVPTPPLNETLVQMLHIICSLESSSIIKRLMTIYYSYVHAVPRITIYNITVLESVGTVWIPINRTGGDLSRQSVIRAVSRDVPGQAVGECCSTIENIIHCSFSQ